MRKRSIFLLILFSFLLHITGCAGPISKQTRAQVTYYGPFRPIQQNPEQYRGEVTILGGKIIGHETDDTGTRLVILHLPLDSNERPRDSDQSEGRFILQSKEFLDPVIFAKGVLITAAGRLIEGQKLPIGQMQYLYPVFDLMEIQKWSPKGKQSPRFHFGVGVGTHF
ncbi:MAG: hypothetical protein GY874_14840 [Desulfobacteraceae bacterium]|nr:hypothetical protein [Desulfobacteraceae bacterium]